tara:strand:+ start:807 stop:944 length:138 start_codon:yes stop_codon:yes gene_type:complete
MPSQNIKALIRLRANVVRGFGLCSIKIKRVMLLSFGEESYVQKAR